MMWFNPVALALLPTTAFSGNECFQAGENDGNQMAQIY